MSRKPGPTVGSESFFLPGLESYELEEFAQVGDEGSVLPSRVVL